ncbi:MAG: hypothetical protein NZM12_00955, partial [Steroidobacteraceae bacterium]|nr:hypothetical protein [Steroidobacteraceae bacterium]
MWWRFWRRRRTKAPQGDIIRSDAAPPPVTASPTEGRIGPSKLVGAYGWLIDAASAQSLDEAVDQGDGVAIAISASGGFASWGQWEFAAPGVSLQGAQKFRIRAFCSVSGGRWQAILCQAGAVVRDLGMASHQRVGAYEVLEWYWDATEVTGVSNVQIRLLPQRDRADGYYSLDAVEWAYSASGAKPEPPTVPQPVEPGQGVTTGELPLPVRTLRAATLDELLRLLASAQPGDHIVLADGTYRPSGGRLQISCVGSADAPIVIRAQNILGAKLPLGFQFAPASKYCWLWGIDFKDAQNSVLSGRGHVVRRCRIWPLPDFTADVRGILVENGSDCRVDYSEIRLYTLAELASLFPGRDWNQGVTYSGISGNTSYAGNNRFDRLTVERCLFKGGIDRPNEYSRPSTSLFSNHGGIQEDMTQNYRHEWTVRLCRVESESGTNILNHNNSGNLFDRVHVVGHGRGVVKFRYTGYCKMDRCRLENCETEIMGGHHVIENSVITGGAWRIFAGTYAWNDASNAALNGYPQAYQVRLSRCAGSVIVGDNWGAAHTFAADGTKIEAHRSGTVTLVSGKQTNTTQPSSTNVPDLAAITI